MLHQLLIVSSVTALAMVTPGPDMALVLRNTIVGGRRAGLHTSLGVLAGNLVHVTYCLLGIGWIISKSILAFATLKYAAAIYLIYLGVASFRAGEVRMNDDTIRAQRSGNQWLMQGWVNNVVNPKGTLFYLGVFTVVIAPDTTAGTMVMLVSCMMLVSASFWLLFVYALDRPLVRNCLGRSQRAVNAMCGALLLYLGLKVAFSDR
jgi:threonine/homoserine/homoserine lactone efflux protein